MGELSRLATVHRHQPDLPHVVVISSQKGEIVSIGGEPREGVVHPLCEDLRLAIAQGHQHNVRARFHRFAIDPGPHKSQALSVRGEMGIGDAHQE
jgi:hypothetical protein